MLSQAKRSCYNDTAEQLATSVVATPYHPNSPLSFPSPLWSPIAPKTIPIRMTQRLPAPLIIEFIQLFPINLIQSLPKNANMVADRPLILAITTALAVPTLVWKQTPIYAPTQQLFIFLTTLIIAILVGGPLMVNRQTLTNTVKLLYLARHIIPMSNAKSPVQLKIDLYY